VINKVNTDEKDDVDLYSILSSYETSVKYIYLYDFKIYANILLRKLKLINDDSKIDAEVVKLNDLYKKGVTTDEKTAFLKDIFVEYIKPHLNYHIDGTIKFKYLRKQIYAKKESKIKADKEKELSITNEKINAKYNEKLANAQIRKAANPTKHSDFYDDPPVYAQQRQNRVNTATEFGPTRYRNVRADIGVASRNTPIFTTTHGRLPVGFND
jgi:hypothetical protein